MSLIENLLGSDREMAGWFVDDSRLRVSFFVFQHPRSTSPNLYDPKQMYCEVRFSKR